MNASQNMMTPSCPAPPSPEIAARTEEIFASSRRSNFQRTDRFFAVLMLVQWLGGIAAALLISPRTWAGAYSDVHIHVRAAVFLGGAVAAFPILLALLRPGEASTRHVIAVGQMLSSALLIHLTGGRIETHFHVFGSLAFLAFYREVSVLVTATVVVAADHWVRGLYFPQSVYGVLTVDRWRWFEHAGWVIFEGVILVLYCRRGRIEMRRLASQQAQLEATNRIIEAEVAQRTADLAAGETRLRMYAASLESANSALAEGKAQLERKQRELEELNAALEQATREARAASEAKSAFLANMSHEIRTPMTAILGFGDLLVDAEHNASDRLNYVNIIRRNGQHLLMLINDILDLSKIEAGMMKVERTLVNPGRVLADVAALFGERAGEKGIRLDVQLDGPVPERIVSDPVRVKQALVNLVGNAIKFTSAGGVTVRLGFEASRGAVVYHVADTGPGIPAEVQTRLFEPFVQADASTTRRFGGTGLGLTISRALARMLGGDLTLESRSGCGSTFSLRIDAGDVSGVPMLTSLESARAELESATASRRLPRLHGRILLVEDGPDNQRLIRGILRRAGAEVDLAENGADGVEAAMKARDEGRPYDVILMDMQMPVMDGYTAAAELRARGYTSQIVALTAHAMSGECQKCIDAGCDHFLSKPITREGLLREVAERLAFVAQI
ncbi:MAG: response regulator [Phycisphaerae bacterium]|nr:MAG: response regulator [Planctomycetota bacterium]KAB2948537.1 MAG: response regulator [Phycisphaerae bacterium]MBE7458789.1 response regulator [Planctomycetia bacterium]MCK6465590.1 response regulator [Phycisphaerae bacterium]MCL4719466.1 response regulator [Phycisphaerae bacterium]